MTCDNWTVPMIAASSFPSYFKSPTLSILRYASWITSKTFTVLYGLWWHWGITSGNWFISKGEDSNEKQKVWVCISPEELWVVHPEHASVDSRDVTWPRHSLPVSAWVDTASLTSVCRCCCVTWPLHDLPGHLLDSPVTLCCEVAA